VPQQQPALAQADNCNTAVGVADAHGTDRHISNCNASQS
jgi:hypothetical protein